VLTGGLKQQGVTTAVATLDWQRFERRVKPGDSSRADCMRKPKHERGKKAMHEELMERVADPENARHAMGAVVANGGAPGIDGMTTEQLESHIERHWGSISAKLLAGCWSPSPLRRVEIPKPSGGKRMLGIPTVVDRWVQQMLLNVLQPIFDSLMSEHF